MAVGMGVWNGGRTIITAAIVGHKPQMVQSMALHAYFGALFSL
jgi:hypothetical protein